MEILTGLYKISKPHVAEEKHGGGILKDEIHWYLAFYDNEVGLYGSGPHDYRRYISKQFDLKGNVVSLDKHDIKIRIYDPYTDRTIIFEGKILDDKTRMILTGSDEVSADKLWIKDVFEIVDPKQIIGN